MKSESRAIRSEELLLMMMEMLIDYIGNEHHTTARKNFAFLFFKVARLNRFKNISLNEEWIKKLSLELFSEKFKPGMYQIMGAKLRKHELESEILGVLIPLVPKMSAVFLDELTQKAQKSRL